MQYKRIVQRVGRVMKVVAVAVILGLAASKVVDLFTADPQVGHWRTQEARSAYERAYRDVLAGIFHPSDDESAHSTVAQSLLGPLS